MSIKKLEVGDKEYIKGFILNKLYLGGYFAKKGKKHHGKHTSTKSLPRGYKPKHRGDFEGIIVELRRDGLILVFPSGKEKHVCAVLSPEKIESGLRLVNAWRQVVELPALDKAFKEVLIKKGEDKG
jgi:hypothetical protein